MVEKIKSDELYFIYIEIYFLNEALYSGFDRVETTHQALYEICKSFPARMAALFTDEIDIDTVLSRTV